MKSRLPRRTRVALACYPPTFQDRYGDEMAVLVEDGGARGTTTNLLVGAARAWWRPVLGPRDSGWSDARLRSTAATVWVAWVAGFFGGGAWLRGITDAIVPALRWHTGWTLYLWGRTAFTVGWVSIAAIVLTLFGLELLRARRERSLAALRPLRTFLLLLASLAVATGVVGALAQLPAAFPAGRGSYPATWFALLGLGWVALAVAMAGSGMSGPVRALRASGLSSAALRRAVRFALVPVVALVVLALAAALLSAYEVAHREVSGWGVDVVAAAGLSLAAAVALGSYLRALPALQKPAGSLTV